MQYNLKKFVNMMWQLGFTFCFKVEWCKKTVIFEGDVSLLNIPHITKLYTHWNFQTCFDKTYFEKYNFDLMSIYLKYKLWH